MRTAATMQPIRGRMVLIVDDSARIRARLRQLFLSDSFTICSEAANGQEAIVEVKKCKPDLVILDLSMPVMNGLEAAPELRKLLPDTPIILYTLHSGVMPDSEFQRIGITEVVAKNEPVESLLQTAKRLLQPRPEEA
jgi:CheY-like chemotaxis protein